MIKELNLQENVTVLILYEIFNNTQSLNKEKANRSEKIDIYS